jgi:hypothetical protein
MSTAAPLLLQESLNSQAVVKVSASSGQQSNPTRVSSQRTHGENACWPGPGVKAGHSKRTWQPGLRDNLPFYEK